MSRLLSFTDEKPMSDHKISASEIGEYAFCPRAWGLKKLGYPSQNRQRMDEGSAFHRKIGRRERLARLLTVLLIAVLGCLILLTLRVVLK